MDGKHRPLVLVVCSDQELLAQVRTQLRKGGYLCASGRSHRSSLALLNQIRVDACVLCSAFTTLESEQLRKELDAMKPGCPKLVLWTRARATPEGWQPSEEDTLLPILERCFSRNGGSKTAGLQPR